MSLDSFGNLSTGSLTRLTTFSDDTTKTDAVSPLQQDKMDRVRKNGWALHQSHPEARLKVSAKTAETHPDHVIVLLLGLVAEDCTKFLVHKTLTLEAFKQNVAQTFQITQPIHIVFDGVSYPITNKMADIHAARARDDRILHGHLVLLDDSPNAYCKSQIRSS